MKSKVNKFFFKIVLLSSPILLLVASYIYFDPMRVIKKYANYKKDCFVELDRDFVSTEVYLQNKEQYKYNAFIFGNSRSLSFLCSDWKQYINNSSAFHYDASRENLIALTQKVKFIDQKNGKLDYALVLLDKELLDLSEIAEGPIFKVHPAIENTSQLSFHSYYFKTYLSEFYFVKYIDYYYTRNYKPYMDGIIITHKSDYNPITNDIYVRERDEALEKDPKKYIQENIQFYPYRDTITIKISDALILDKQVALLTEIKKVFVKKKTNYKIVINPMYYQKYLNKKDVEKLQSIFGKENVYDFSGKNEYSRNIEDYYEQFHFRPKTGRAILKKIYGNN